jgi:hypothetical protein
MDRSHAQQLANQTLVGRVTADPLWLPRAIASGEAEKALSEAWDQAGTEIPPIFRTQASGFAATMERHGLYTFVHVMPPAPRVSGDPAAIMIIGRGDGASKLSGIGYYVLSLVVDATGIPRFTMASREARETKPVVTIEGPLPEPVSMMEYAFALYEGRKPEAVDRSAEVFALPAWYWWYAFDGTEALRFFAEMNGDPERFEAVRRFPILLLPEIADAAGALVDEEAARAAAVSSPRSVDGGGVARARGATREHDRRGAGHARDTRARRDRRSARARRAGASRGLRARSIRALQARAHRHRAGREQRDCAEARDDGRSGRRARRAH